MLVELLNITNDPQKLIEEAARTCYQSHDKSYEGSDRALIKKLLGRGHETPLEHASATFRITGVSRALSHQLVRHRLMSISQKSQRYVNEQGFEFVVPDSIKKLGSEDEFIDDMIMIKDMYYKWNRVRGIPEQDARFVLPNACTTELVITGNFREFRHIFELRCSPNAQWEIRKCVIWMLNELYSQAPAVFEDLYNWIWKPFKT